MFLWFLTVGLNVLWFSLAVCQKSSSTLPCIKLDYYRKSKIVGGINAEPGETPYIASLTRRGGHFCGATVLNNRWLLTAGHCVCNGLNRIMKPTQIKAILGLYQISQFQENSIGSNAQEMDLKQIVPHHRYKCSDTSNDIALLELYKPIQFNENVKPACITLRKNDDKLSGQMAVVFGWGWTNEDQSIGHRADILQKASIIVWDNDLCQKSFNENAKGHFISDTQLCAGHLAGGIDSCWADSGGPLVTNGNTLIGVVSTGVGCARPGLPGIYTRVSEYVDWIEEIIST